MLRPNRLFSLLTGLLSLGGSVSDTDKDGDDSEKKHPYRTTRLSDEECRRLQSVVERIMTEERPYLNPDLKSRELADMAGTTSHALSYLFNQYLKKSWSDYVNEYRVAEFKALVAGDEEVSRYTLSALSQKCGFSSRASFFRRFKSIAGITPAEYMKNRLSSAEPGNFINT
ncbi:MAG: helix-turn-helix domain-containing protein [Muribaculaceae bacterium]|nr:helix-turn-helix domain-containing protein [Muribaculaceae bacterium]